MEQLLQLADREPGSGVPTPLAPSVTEGKEKRAPSEEEKREFSLHSLQVSEDE